MDYSLEEEIIEHIFDKIKSSVFPSESNNYKSGFLQSNFLLYVVVLLLVLKIITVSVSINFPANIFFADITKSSLENFVNGTRQSVGLPALAENTKLDQAAQLKAENMVQDQYFNHTSPTGVSPWFWFLQAGYNYKYAGENLAIGFFDSTEVYQAWLNSPEHKANIVNPNYTQIGTAVRSGFGNNNTIVVVQEFGSPAPAKQVVAKNNSVKPQPVAKITSTPQSTPVNTSEQVLSQSTELQTPAKNVENGLSSKIINSIPAGYNNFLQDIIYGVSLVVIGILLTLIFFNFKISFKRQLVYRALLIVILLSAATFINKEIIVSFIPHQVTI